MPHFTHPAATAEYDGGGALVGIRYDYPAADNILLRDVVPLLEEAGVDLVYSGHNHLWNRFVSPAGVHYLEGSNTGNSFGAFHPRSGRTRPAPSAPWNTEDVVRQGNPGGLPPVLPILAPRCDEAGRPQPFVADGNLVVFHALHTGRGTVTSWYVDLNSADHRVVRFDEFTL
ncbi:hypothetical protein [Mycolicibacterium goodii]|uniref:Uncharacterized protein n=1 Tax=Mycolicibacterium goodii TaxID=134601 RepID=A0A0K0XB01_MYCGD|nr:hypothetical protein AFA91_24785 [Mycolicibacterium goodii]